MKWRSFLLFPAAPFVPASLRHVPPDPPRGQGITSLSGADHGNR
jgi:hypothetical protein